MRAFSTPEGEDEFKRLVKLVSKLITRSKPSELIGFVAKDRRGIEFQGKDIVQRLINHSLDNLRSRKVD